MHFYKILLVSLLLISCKDKAEQPVKTEIKKITKKIPKQTKKEFLLNDDNAIPYFFEYGKKNKENKNKENQSRSTTKEDQNQSSQSGIYLRDDHCDWGSSGRNEFTNEFSENN